MYSIISIPDEIQLYDSRGQVTQFARHQAAHGETSSKIPFSLLSLRLHIGIQDPAISNIEVPGLHRTTLGDDI